MGDGFSSKLPSWGGVFEEIEMGSEIFKNLQSEPPDYSVPKSSHCQDTWYFGIMICKHTLFIYLCCAECLSCHIGLLLSSEKDCLGMF